MDPVQQAAGTLIAGVLVWVFLTERVPGMTWRTTLAQIALSLLVGWVIATLLLSYGIIDPARPGPYEDPGI